MHNFLGVAVPGKTHCNGKKRTSGIKRKTHWQKPKTATVTKRQKRKTQNATSQKRKTHQTPNALAKTQNASKTQNAKTQNVNGKNAKRIKNVKRKLTASGYHKRKTQNAKT